MPRPIKKSMGEDMMGSSMNTSMNSASSMNTGRNSMKDDCCADMSAHHMHSRHHRGGKFAKCAAGILFLVLAVGAGSQLLGNPWYKNIKAEFTSQPYARTITVEAEGKVTVKPDIAKVDLTVVSTGKTVKEVTQDSNTKMAAITSTMKNLGIKPEDLQTTSYSLNPTYPPYDPNKYGVDVQTITGYSINQTLSVKIRDLAKTDDVLDQAVSSGANQVGQLTFDLDDASQVKSDARKMAFDKAKDKAKEMSGAAGVKIGKVVTFSESTNGYAVPYANFAVKAMSDEASVAPSVEAGSKEFTINVSVTYEIE